MRSASLPLPALPPEAGLGRQVVSMTRGETCDFDVHGLLGVRALNSSPRDRAAVARHLGGMTTSNLLSEADIEIEFVDEIETPRLRYLGSGEYGFSPEGHFVLLDRKQKARLKLDFTQVGGRVRIVCRSGLKAVPLLTAIVHLTALAKGFVSMHASAFVHRGTGVVTAGWAKGGKTEALLAFAAQGADVVGDEWIIFSPDGEKMYGIPEHIRLWDWHLEQLPQVKSRVGLRDRLLFSAIHTSDRLHAAAEGIGIGSVFPMPLLRRALPALRRQLNVTLMVEEVFASNDRPLTGRPERLFLMVSHEGDETVVEESDAAEVARRMLHSVHYEQLPLLKAYAAFRYAFPNIENRFLEGLNELQSRRLSQALAGRKAFIVRHPYPCRLENLYREMQRYC